MNLDTSQRPTTTLKTDDGNFIQIKEPYTGSTRNAINIVLQVEDDIFGIVMSAEEAHEFACTLRIIAERIMTEQYAK